MKIKFIREPFDIAPKAPRYTPAAWKALGAGLAFLALCSWPLATSLQALQRANNAQSLARQMLGSQAEALRSVRQRLSDPAMVEKIKAQQRLQQMVRMSWFGLFDALESAAQGVRGGVSILSLIPSQAQADATQVRLTALAANAPIMLEYIRVLRKDPRILQADLTSQQTDGNVGPGVIRLQMTVLWNPQATMQQTVAPEETPTLNQVASTTLSSEPVAKVVIDKGAP
jgi:hypothetical protein